MRRGILAAMLSMLSASLRLGSVEVSPSCVEHVGKLTYCASLRPLLQGHIIVAPVRSVARLGELTAAEYDDIFLNVRLAQARMRLADASVVAFNVAIKDGAASGQPVEHVHAHVVPRRKGDLKRNDDIYVLLDDWRPDLSVPEVEVRLDVPDDDGRLPRTADAMADEARLYGTDCNIANVRFGKFDIDPRQVFLATETCLAIVNLKPLVPGHVLVIPRRGVPLLADLDDKEHADLWRCAKIVADIVTRYHAKSSANLAVQDGGDAGQSVPHVSTAQFCSE